MYSIHICNRLALWASLCCVALECFAQTFNEVHYNQSSGFAVGHSVREIDSGFLVFGVQTQQDTTGQDITVTGFNVNGQLTSEKYFHYPRFESYGLVDPVANAFWSSGYLGAINHRLGPEPVDTVSLVRFDNNGDTLWTRPLVHDTVCYAIKLAANDEAVYITGLKASGVLLTNSVFVMRTDTSGNEEMFFIDQSMESFGMDVDGAGNIYVAGREEDVANAKAYLMRVDSSGHKDWFKIGPYYNGIWNGVKVMFDDRVLCMGSWNHYNGDTAHMGMTMYDTSGTWHWEYEGLRKKNIGLRGNFVDAFQDSDTTFIVCGPIQQLAWNRAVIYRFTQDGDSLWRRDYAHFNNLSALYPEIPWDIEPTSDGGMVLTGETWNPDTVPPISNVNMWLLKLDSMGCLVPGCHTVGVQDYAYGLQDAIKVFPNPSDGQFQIELDFPHELEMNGDLQLTVLDVQGRTILQEQLVKHTLNGRLDLTAHPPGMYYLHLSDESRWLTGTKLIVEY